ncbi:TIGR03986 family CRISPR-associated RAMP protein [Sulfurimonas sp. RIFOXYB12_FULL_35_9]|uniref:TIGR03986 family type III CRISPR-associated RAMP protein n=1 Tax=Sulfurimonas sp. RIFOXYB12_FULL_35_9 TaxID=1802256 RepID=UPI0008C11E91|nr:TIGR03986 family CRISPR-associated RAMP protein [Sulfurimonas sp. RIFOXYB12_FULL_35_9]OHE05235.1 MAG: CRISPR-associated RAMP family protein [Sulfurimonas sp. RIFOXYB12_FULL_35_9]
MITAPYNFVPLNKEVFYPSWSNDGKEVSHDVPFEDGESGEIEITITAKSPIFIRNHSDDKDKPSSEFCHHINQNGAKEFYIPGSSLKGMVRSVLEILSFSKMRVDKKSLGQYFGVRDMTDKKMETLVGKANGLTNDKSFGYGILTKTDKGYQLEDYGNKIRLILQRDLKTKIDKYNGSQKDVSKKYTTVQPFTTIKVKPDQNNNPQKRGFFDKYTVVPDDNGEDGELFFGGHFGKKHYEFVLLKSDKQRVNKTLNFSSDDTVIQKFKTVYFDNQEKDNYVGNYWRGKDKIPVFYLKSNDSSIKQIGLTQLFKVAYEKNFLEAICQKPVDSKFELDLSETIFGTENENLALKGRVYFGHLKCTIPNLKPMNTVEQVLGSPRPTYYPNYISQTGQNGKVSKYKTLMDKDAVISGWKRYPLQPSIQPDYPLPKNADGKINHDVATKFKPLDSGTVFKGSLRFHNLKKAEIGALLSAITFHGQSEKHLHNIGMAKPLGYGKIDMQLTPKNLKYSQQEYLKEFENEMTKKIKDWRNSPQLKELFAMASIDTKPSDKLRYQLLENPNPKEEYSTTNKQGKKVYENNDFTGAKKAREYLMKFSTINSPNQQPSKKENHTNTQPSCNVEKSTENQKPTVSSPVLRSDNNGISKTKIRKVLQEKWNTHLKIFYHPNQIDEFLSGKFITTPHEQAEVYLRLQSNEIFKQLVYKIGDFNNDKLDEYQRQNLYEEILNFHFE